MKEFREDIQGLRAIAVTAVLLFHINPLLVPGGYVGVDVFFVISGFLISGIIWRELGDGRFGFSNFYARRIKRLYPALTAVLIATIVATAVLALPDESRKFGISLVASMLYVSNVYFITETDYFASDLDLNPLLHTWSLSVEEQFYLVLPLLLFLVFKYSRRQVVPVVIGLIVVSYAICELMMAWQQRIAFFAAPARFFQFAIGALVALAPVKQDRFSRPIMELLGWAGLAMILASICLYSGQTRFPGYHALLPTVGTALVIFAGQRKGLTCSAALSVPIALFLGEISYSLYLWHWPIVTFYKVGFSPTPSLAAQSGLLIASVACGYLGWRFVENPFRRIRVAGPSRIWFAAGSVTVAMSAVGLGLILTGGPSQRFSDDELRLATYLDYSREGNRPGVCFLTSDFNSSELFDDSTCIQVSDSKPNYLLMGDSHAAHWIRALTSEIPEVSFSQLTASGCKPAIAYYGERRCTDLMRRGFEELLPSGRFDGVILSAWWHMDDRGGFVRTLRYLKDLHVNVIVLGPIVSYRQALPRLLARYRHDETDGPEILAARLYGETQSADDMMSMAAHEGGATYVSVLNAICPESTCTTITKSGIPMQWDIAHLTYEGAVEVVQRVRSPILESVFRQKSGAGTR